MRTSRIPVLCTAAVVALSGCAAGGAANHPAGPSPTASGSPTAVHIGQYTQEFAGSVPAEPAQASVIAGFRQAQVLWDQSEQAWRLVPPVTQFVTGDALAHLRTAIAVDKQEGVVFAGTDELFMTRVTRLSSTAATVTTCDNDSKFSGVYKATGKVDSAYAPSADQTYLLEYWNMVRTAGHWAIGSFSVISLPDSRARPCQP